MSAIGAWLARAVAAVGGPQTGAIVLVAGLVAGGAGGALIATNARNTSPAVATVPVYPCPNQGPALQTIANGDKLLVTGRLADDSWVRIHLPTPGRTEGWVEAGPLTVSGSIDSLPVATCAAEAGAPSPAIVPVESLTAVVTGSPSPAPAPTPTIGPSPSPSPSPSNTGPTLASLAASTRTISYDQGSYCPTAAKSVTITVKASDSSGVASATLFWRKPGASSFSQATMTRTAGSAARGTWQATLNTTANGLTSAGTLAYYVVATDTLGATRRIPSSGTSTIAVAVCANKGPTITSVASSSGSSLYWDPLSVGTCQRAPKATTTNITAVVSDPDGVKSVTLYYRRPGASSYSSKPMDNHTVPGKWYANLDTLGDKISIPKPPTGSLSWYIKAVDLKNVSAQTKTVSMSIRRCDSQATFGLYVSPTSMCLNTPTTFYVDVTDADGLIKSSAVLVYTYLLTSGASKTVKAQMTYSDNNGPTHLYYRLPLQALKTWSLRAPVTWYAQSTDVFGGVSRSAVQKIAISPTGC